MRLVISRLITYRRGTMRSVPTGRLGPSFCQFRVEYLPSRGLCTPIIIPCVAFADPFDAVSHVLKRKLRVVQNGVTRVLQIPAVITCPESWIPSQLHKLADDIVDHRDQDVRYPWIVPDGLPVPFMERRLIRQLQYFAQILNYRWSLDGKRLRNVNKFQHA